MAAYTPNRLLPAPIPGREHPEGNYFYLVLLNFAIASSRRCSADP